MVRHIISKQAVDLLVAYGATDSSEEIPNMPGYFWADLDEDVSNELRAMIDWASVDDNAQAEADALSEIIIRLCTRQIGRG